MNIESIREVFWEWDPVGIKLNRLELADEYDGLVELARAMLAGGATPLATSERIANVLREDWGVDSVPAQLADLLMANS